MRYHNITKDDMLNGEGLRVVLWVSGCEHGCKNCHNPVTWDVNSGLPFDLATKIELFEELEKDYISGITLSGGDPLHCKNRDDITNLIEEIKEIYPMKTIWLYTGYMWEDIACLASVRNVDVLVDGQYIEGLNDSTTHWKGSLNQRVIDVKKSLENGQVILYKE